MDRIINTRSPFYLQFTSAGNETEATNIMGMSERLDQWNKTNASVTSNVTSYSFNTFTAPDGTNTSDQVSRDSTSPSYLSKAANKPSSAVGTYTLSVFVKQADTRYVSMRAQGLYPDRLDMQYDFETMQLSYIDNYGTDFSFISSHVEQYNGWTRIGVTVESDDHSQISMSLSPKDDANEGIDANDSNSSGAVFAWGGQIEHHAIPAIFTGMSSYISTPDNNAVARASTTTSGYDEQEVSLDLAIYTGYHRTEFQGSEPSVTYTLSKSPTNGLTTFEASELVRDFIEQNSNTSSGVVFVKATLYDGVQFDREYDFVAVEGYNTRKDGVQTIDTMNLQSKLMQTNTDVTIPEGMSLQIPVYANRNASYNIDSAASNTRFDANTTTDNQIQYFTLNSTDSSVDIKNLGTTTQTINVSVAECGKYPVNMLTFVNKLGAKQDLYFEMKSTQKVSAKYENFRRNTLDFSDLTANSLKHTRKRRVKSTNETFKLNTGFLTENNAQAIEELLVSEYVWLTQADSTVIPVNITDNSIQRKTHLNDNLIQYTINVEASAPYLNNYR